MDNKYISRYAKHDTHFERVSDKNYYFDNESDQPSFGVMLVSVILCSCLIYGGIYFLLSF